MTSAAPVAAPAEKESWLAGGMMIVFAIALAKLLLHCYFNNRYGYFRDEFDYLACGDHLAWGYVDQPPMVPFLVRISRILLGDSLRSIRFLPALVSSLLVLQTAVLAREFGGRRFALLLSAVTALIAPQYLSNGSLLGTNCLEPNLWMAAVISRFWPSSAMTRAIGFGLAWWLAWGWKKSIPSQYSASESLWACS